MAYYQLFVSTLFNSLNKKLASRKLSAHVGGYTLPGFQLKPGHLNGAPLPASLKSQVRHTEELIKIALDEHIHKGNEGDDTTKRPKVIFIAHSIGAYIALEILRRRADGHNDLSGVDIVGGVFVCPTVTHIAQSRNGGRVNVCLQVIVVEDVDPN
jgi:pimeloyl-ACP methyl ester carboxylesterase